jgi:hypothetical protein
MMYYMGVSEGYECIPKNHHVDKKNDEKARILEVPYFQTHPYSG